MKNSDEYNISGSPIGGVVEGKRMIIIERIPALLKLRVLALPLQ